MDTLLTARTKVRRLPERGAYDRDTVHAILDAGFICHLGFTVDSQPYVIPTGYARVGDRVYIHGSTASRMVRTLSRGVDVCMTVTLVDGFVLARSAFHHSVNYRSVVVLGRARLVTEAAEKWEALRGFTNHVAAGRFEEVRTPNEQELKGTSVLALSLEEASAKVRTGPPNDDEDDLGLNVWAGVAPIVTTIGDLVPDGDVGASAFDPSRLVIVRNR